MAVTSVAGVSVTYSGGEVTGSAPFATQTTNTACVAEGPAPLSLTSGNNTVAIPAGHTAFTLFPPAGNTAAISLKGVNGDTGFRLHNTQPSQVSFDVSETNVVLNVGANMVCRIAWS